MTKEAKNWQYRLANLAEDYSNDEDLKLIRKLEQKGYIVSATPAEGLPELFIGDEEYIGRAAIDNFLRRQIDQNDRKTGKFLY